MITDVAPASSGKHRRLSFGFAAAHDILWTDYPGMDIANLRNSDQDSCALALSEPLQDSVIWEYLVNYCTDHVF